MWEVSGVAWWTQRGVVDDGVALREREREREREPKVLVLKVTKL